MSINHFVGCFQLSNLPNIFSKRPLNIFILPSFICLHNVKFVRSKVQSLKTTASPHPELQYVTNRFQNRPHPCNGLVHRPVVGRHQPFFFRNSACAKPWKLTTWPSSWVHDNNLLFVRCSILVNRKIHQPRSNLQTLPQRDSFGRCEFPCPSQTGHRLPSCFFRTSPKAQLCSEETPSAPLQPRASRRQQQSHRCLAPHVAVGARGEGEATALTRQPRRVLENVAPGVFPPLLSHNQNPVLKWLTQNHVRKHKGGRNYFLLGLSLTNLHLPGF